MRPTWWRMIGGTASAREFALPFPLPRKLTVLPAGDLLNTLTPLLAISSALAFLLAAAALLRWRVPAEWFQWLVIAGVVFSIILQAIWFSPWAVLPLLVDVALLWAVFTQQVTVAGLRG